MLKTIAGRILIMIPQLILLSLLLFIFAGFMPGDALTGKIDPGVSPARLEELRQKWGFYDPWHVKYFRWVTNLLKGDLGESSANKIPVTQLIAHRAVNTFWLGLVTFILIYLIAIPLGLISGRFHNKLPDKLITAYTFLALAMPTVIFALINIFIFSFKLKLFPMGGTANVQDASVVYKLYHLALPALTGALLYNVSIIQFLRSEIIDYEHSNFVLTARSKGVPKRYIYTKHIFRNALIPISSFTGYYMASLLTGSIFIEYIFSYPGMGSLFVTSVQCRDYAVANALIILFAIVTVLGNLLSDIIISLADPRIRIR